MSLNVREAALWAIVAIDLVLIGAIITPGTLSVEQRGPVLAGIVGSLFAVGLRMRRGSNDDG